MNFEVRYRKSPQITVDTSANPRERAFFTGAQGRRVRWFTNGLDRETVIVTSLLEAWMQPPPSDAQPPYFDWALEMGRRWELTEEILLAVRPNAVGLILVGPQAS